MSASALVDAASPDVILRLLAVVRAARALADTMHREGIWPAFIDAYDDICIAIDALGETP